MENAIPEHQFICRACLKVVEQTTQSFGYVDDATGHLRDMLMCCIPEMDIYVSFNPIICFGCIQALIHVHNFKARCINTENIIRTYMKKYNMPSENPINLGSVVRDLIEINKIRQRLLMEQEAVANAVPPSSPPPLHFLEGSGQSQPPVLPVHNVHQASTPNTTAVQQMVPMSQKRSGSSLTSVPPTIINGLGTFPAPLTAIPIKQDIHSSNSTSESNINIPYKETSTQIYQDSVTTNNNITNMDNKYSVTSTNNISSEINKNKPTFHSIESKMRLVIRIPRSKISLPFQETVNQFPNHNDSSNSNETNNDEQEMAVGGEMIPEDQEMTNFENDMQVSEEHINNFYTPDIKDVMPNNHITKLYNCSCMYLTTSLSLFEEHKKKCKTGKIGTKSLFKCPHCPHVTNRPYALNKHINTMHTKAVWFVCEFCTYRSTDKSCLRRHIRKNHEQKANTESSRQFPCHICDMVISSQHNYNRHMLKHEDSIISMYNCEFCSYHSKDRSNYRKHVFTHSPHTLQCPSCSYNNVSPYQLRAHIKKNHNGVGVEVADCKSDIPVCELVKEIKALISIADQQMTGYLGNQLEKFTGHQFMSDETENQETSASEEYADSAENQQMEEPVQHEFIPDYTEHALVETR